jgi:hypothetical protein
VEVLGELGVVGIALLLIVLGTIAAVLVARVRGPDRTLYGAVLAALVAWLAHAGLDWDWEMPAITLWVFALGGAALAAPSHRQFTAIRLGPYLRPVAILACFGVAIVPGLVLVSDERLEASARAFERGDCGAALDAANDSIATVGTRPEPYEIRAYCFLRARSWITGVNELDQAVERDPDNWQYHYGLARAQAAAGIDPRREAARALRLNPLEADVQEAARRLSGTNRAEWVRQGRALVRGAPPFYLSTR